VPKYNRSNEKKKSAAKFRKEVHEEAILAKETGDLTALFWIIRDYIYQMAINWLDENFNLQDLLDTDDLVAEAYKRLVQVFGQYDESKPFIPWMGWVVKRHWINLGMSLTRDWKRRQTHIAQEGLVEKIETASISADPYDQADKLKEIEFRLDKSAGSTLGYVVDLYRNKELSYRSTRQLMRLLGYIGLPCQKCNPVCSTCRTEVSNEAEA
jgi:hypothetical protein